MSPSLALAAYAESLIVGRRVLVFGDACSPLADALLERGARLVHVCDPDPARVAEGATRNTSSHVSFAPLGEGGLGIRDGAFEVALVENLAALSGAEALLRRLKRALSGRGVALIASPNPDCRTRLLTGTLSGPALDYYALYDLITSQFEHVRMVGQAPFLGYTLADFAPEGEPEPTFDTGYLHDGSEEPEWFVAVASQHPAELDSFLVVELPAAQVLHGASTRALEQQLRQAQQAELRARERMAEIEARLERQPPPVPQDDERLSVLKAELEKKERWIRSLEARADTADARADAAESELESLRQEQPGALAEARMLGAKVTELERALTLEQAKLEQELSTERAKLDKEREAERTKLDKEREAELAKLDKEREAKRTKLDKEREAELAKLDKEREAERARTEQAVQQAQKENARLVAELAHEETRLRELSALEAESTADLQKLEQQLAERGQEIQRLERQLADAQRVGRELVAELETSQTRWPVIESLKAQVERLSVLNAEREGDIAAAKWSIQSLELELGSSQESSGR